MEQQIPLLPRQEATWHLVSLVVSIVVGNIGFISRSVATDTDSAPVFGAINGAVTGSVLA